MVESQVASELSNMVQPSRDDELERTHVNIGTVAQELVRRTDILGTAISQVAENAGHNNKKVAEDIQKWAEQLSYQLMHNLQELGKRIPQGRSDPQSSGKLRYCTGACIKDGRAVQEVCSGTCRVRTMARKC